MTSQTSTCTRDGGQDARINTRDRLVREAAICSRPRVTAPPAPLDPRGRDVNAAGLYHAFPAKEDLLAASSRISPIAPSAGRRSGRGGSTGPVERVFALLSRVPPFLVDSDFCSPADRQPRTRLRDPAQKVRELLERNFDRGQACSILLRRASGPLPPG